MPRSSKRARSLETLLASAGLPTDIVAVEPLNIGWPGPRGGGYRDDDGTHVRVRLADGRSTIYREYADTGPAAPFFRQKEASVFDRLRDGGLPTPEILAASDGVPGGGEPAAMLLSDRGGQPLEDFLRDGSAAPPALLREVGRVLRQLHDTEVRGTEYFASEWFERAWIAFVPYFGRTISKLRQAHPELRSHYDELRKLLRGELREHLESRPKAICAGHFSFPGVMLEQRGRAWAAVGWLSLGYYVSIGDPDRDVVALATRYRLRTGHDVPDAFYTGYGRPPDPVAAVVYNAYFHLRAHPEDVRRVVDQLAAFT